LVRYWVTERMVIEFFMEWKGYFYTGDNGEMKGVN
jgi:hypothetical protein